MVYILAGFLVAIGWFTGKLLYEVAGDLLFSRLHKAKWYLVAAGKEPKEVKSKPGDAKAVKNQIGFM